MKKGTVIGVDLAKKTVVICAMSSDGAVLYKKSLSRRKFSELLATTDADIIAMESCGGSHHWARLCESLGLRVMVIHPKRVKSFAPSRKKNDYVDAEAICEAALNKSTKPLRVKSKSQQDIDTLMNYRSQLVKQQVALMNQVHGIGLEYGLDFPKGGTPKQLEKIHLELENAENELTLIARKTIRDLLGQAQQRNEDIVQITKELKEIGKHSECFKLLKSIPGVGDIVAIAILAHTAGDVSGFKNGRQFAASLGLVPRQYSTGGKSKLLGITKTGNAQLRGLLYVGTRSIMTISKNKEGKFFEWVNKMKESKGWKVGGVAVANKIARIVFAVLKKQEEFIYN